MNQTKIKININDIFEYVVGNTSYDPIEKHIDPTRFEIFDTCIYDNQLKISIEQDDKYKYFCSEVTKLRAISKEMDPREIKLLCDELSEVAPTEINLG